MTILTPNIAIRRPSAGWGLSRLSIKRSVIRQGAIGSSPRRSDGGCGEGHLLLTPLVRVARWMLKQVQHDAGRSAPFCPRRTSAGWGLLRLSIKRSVASHGTIGSSPCRSDGGCGERDFPLTPSVCVARWMLKQVQHDAGRSISPRPLRRCVNPNPRRSNIYATLS
jgi:hypothetical protein